MRQKTVGFDADFERNDRETEQEKSLDPMEEMAFGTERGAYLLRDLRRLAWLGVKLCNSLLHRWLNLCEVVVEEVFYVLLMPHFFAEVELSPAIAPQETANLHSRHLLRENDFLGSANSPDSSGERSQFAISWRKPWLYLVLVLLVWLLLF
ncbi:MAG: hypothetical protein WBQ94_09760 [Terracidiphilus sp.]